MLVLFDQKYTSTLEATTASPGLRMGGWTRQWKKQLIGVESIAQQRGALGPHSSHVRGGGAGVGPSLLPHAQCLTEPLGCGSSVRFLHV